MSDELLQAIEQRLAERQRAKSASHTHAQRAAAIESLMRRSRRDANAKARLDKLLKKFLQFAEFMSIPEAVEPKPEVAAADKVAETNGIETVREMTRRQMREASEADMPIPDPPKPEWHDGGYRPGLSVANKLKRFFSKEMPENGSWMGKR
jgi:hypothetical protein